MHRVLAFSVVTLGFLAAGDIPYRLRQVAEVWSGADALCEVVCGDTDQDSLAEFTYWLGSPDRWQTWEYRPKNLYELVKSETCLGNPYPPPGINKGTFLPCDVDDIDCDGLAEIVGDNVKVFGDSGHLDSVQNHLCLYESPAPGEYPDTLVWHFHYGTQLTASPHAWFPGDLDQDGRKEIVFYGGTGVTYVFENRGDNQNELVYTTPFRYYGYDYAFGDFDLDNQNEFVCAPVWSDYVYVFECTGDDQYALTDSIFHYYPNGADVFSGNDLDQDGKPEFYIVYVRISGTCVFYVVMYEATGNNTYEGVLIDSLYGANYSQARHSVCSDIDLDGVEELLVSYNSGISIYRATGNNAFGKVFNWQNPMPNGESHIQCHDMNGNGYPDVVISGNAHTWFLEMEAIRVLAPNGGEELVPNETCLVRWRTYDPPRCDSVSLFLSRGWKYPLDTIATGLASGDTVYPWIVPPGPRDSCRIFAVAYGPGWQYDESDSCFAILPVGAARGETPLLLPARLPTVVRGVLFLTSSPFVIHSSLFDFTGRKVATLHPGENDVSGLAPGVYFVRAEAAGGGRSAGSVRKLVIQH